MPKQRWFKPDDSLWKAIIEDVFDDFLRFFFHQADELFAMEKGFEFLDKELEQLFPPQNDSFAPKYVDKLVKVFMKDGREEWILVHIEVQGYKDKLFAERMFTYYYRIFDKYNKPITAFAIFTDDNLKHYPNKFEKSFLGTSISYKYNTYTIAEQSEQELVTSNNPFAIVILAVKAALKSKRINELEVFQLKVDLAKTLLQKQFSKEKIRALMNFLKYHIRFDNEETIIRFDKEIELLTGKSKTMGIEEFLINRATEEGKKIGLEEGIELQKESFVIALLKETEFNSEKIAQLAGVSLAFVEKVKKESETK
ncbi:RpnC/YadD family protein [Emticicia soli]|uniref:Transposase (putative) YhgA-like domain-containing protein n=1 Tax=Emticicia soli TaxID=2027878 RepID=A0ABW5JDZ0_9BACT